MARKVGQVRFFANGSSQNYPSGLTSTQMRHGTAFSKYYPLVRLGVQALPGTKFYINGYTTPVVVGSTGIYELDIEGLSTISDLQFDATSLETIARNDAAYIYVDFIYEQGS